MNNKEYLDTLNICGVLEIMDKDYEDLCESLLDISKILDLYAKYKKKDRYNVVVNILGFIVRNIKKESELEIIYSELLNVLEIGLKYGITYKNKSLETNIFLKLNYVEISAIELKNSYKMRHKDGRSMFDRYMDILDSFKILYIGAFDANKVRIDGVEYKLVADDNNTIMLENKGVSYERMLWMVKLYKDKVEMMKFDNLKDKGYQEEKVRKILKSKRDYFCIVRAYFL